MRKRESSVAILCQNEHCPVKMRTAPVPNTDYQLLEEPVPNVVGL